MRPILLSSLFLFLFVGCTAGGAGQRSEPSSTRAQVARPPSIEEKPYARRELSREESAALSQSLPKSARRILEQAAELELSSFPAKPGEKVEKKIITVGEAGTKAELLDALYAGIIEAASPSACFYPRHSVRATSGGETVELQICFECSNFRGSVGGEKFGGRMGQSPLQLFTRLLTSGAGAI